MISEFKDEYRFLSNFWLCEVAHEGLLFTSSEAAYQAAKTGNRKLRIPFTSYAPGLSKRKGRELQIRPDWDSVKISVMTDILRDKFTRDENLRLLLIQTDPHELIEGNYWGDTFWGVDWKKGGQNHLGKLLMQLREKLILGDY